MNELPNRPHTEQPELSVVIPAYNEEKRIEKCLLSVMNYLESKQFSSEIIVVDDGSTDRTRQLAERFGQELANQPEKIKYRAVSNFKNIGKGFSVSRGLALAEGKRVLFTDVDLSAPIGEADKLASWLDKGYDMAIASRRMPDSRVEPQPLYRRFMGAVFGLLTSLIVVRGYKDTQCGFKMYSHKGAKAISGLQVMPGFVFDVEHLFLAKRLGFKVKEVPVFWSDDRDTRVRVFRDPFRMALGLIKVRIAHSGLTEDRGR